MTGFDLLALRARCTANLRSGRGRVKRSVRREGRKFADDRCLGVTASRGPGLPCAACVAPSCTRRPARRSRSPCCSRCSEWGTIPEKLAELAGARARPRPGRDGAAAHLVLGPPDPRSVALRVGVPRGERRLQPDVRRLVAPRDARRGGGLLLGRSEGTRRRVARDASSSLDLDEGRADRVGRRRGDDPGGADRLCARGRHRGAISASRGRSRSSSPAFGLLLGWADRRPATRTIGDLTLRQGVAVGLAQSLSLMPGVSRSGITITVGRFLGLDRDSAARFSFLLLLPITFAAVVFKGLTDVVLADLPSGMTGPFVVGVLASLGSGLLAIVVPARLRAKPQLRRLRDLPARRRGRHRPADRTGVRAATF